jgi:hypothetical protein
MRVVFASAASPHLCVLISALAHTKHNEVNLWAKRKQQIKTKITKTEGSKDQGAVIIPCYALLSSHWANQPLRRANAEHCMNSHCMNSFRLFCIGLTMVYPKGIIPAPKQAGLRAGLRAWH